MHIIAKHVLGIIRSVEGASNSVIAGGAVRDTLLDKPIKDYDIFVPHKAYQRVISMLKEREDINGVPSAKKYLYAKNFWVKGVYDFKHEGLDFQIIANDLEDTEDFPNLVLSKFDFGINMVWFDGTMIEESPQYEEDYLNNKMSLLNLSDVKYLPKYLDRFQRINKKYDQRFTFACPCIRLVNQVEGAQFIEPPVRSEAARVAVELANRPRVPWGNRVQIEWRGQPAEMEPELQPLVPTFLRLN